MALADPRTHTAAVIAQLEAASLVVGDGDKPSTAHGWQQAPGQSPFRPYVVVYPINQNFDGGLALADDHSDFTWQVTCVGASREQCERTLAVVDAALVGQTLTVAGRSILRVRGDGGARGARRDDTVQPPTFIASPHYSALST